MKPHNIIFENTKEAAMKNIEILETCNNSYGDLLETQKDTILEPGSEFRSVDNICLLWHHHR